MAELRELGLMLQVYLALAGASGLVCLWLWFGSPRSQRWRLPPQRQRLIPWSGLELILALLIYYFLPSLFSAALGASPDPTGSINIQLVAWARILAAPLQLIGLIALVRLSCDAQLYQLGFTLHRW